MTTTKTTTTMSAGECEAHDLGHEAGLDWCRTHDGPADAMIDDLRSPRPGRDASSVRRASLWELSGEQAWAVRAWEAGALAAWRSECPEGDATGTALEASERAERPTPLAIPEVLELVERLTQGSAGPSQTAGDFRAAAVILRLLAVALGHDGDEAEAIALELEGESSAARSESVRAWQVVEDHARILLNAEQRK